jgi:DNA-binding response OmpR family regulator
MKNKPPRILVVEDDAEVRLLLAEVAEEGGYAVSCVSDYPSALAAIEADPPHLIVTDLWLCGNRNGSDLAACARSLGIPTLIISGATERLDKLAATGILVLQKPFHVVAFEAKLAEMMLQVA